MKNFTLIILIGILFSCSPDNSEIRDRAINNLLKNETINYEYNRLTIEGSTQDDTTFIETYSSASFLRTPQDSFIGYNYVIQDSLIHPRFLAPIKNIYHYNGHQLYTAIVSPMGNSIAEKDIPNINMRVFNNVMAGQLPAILNILQNEDSEVMMDSIVNDQLCIQLSVIKDKKPHSLFISKKTFHPVMLRITTNLFQPFIQEFSYKNFKYSSKLNVPDYRAEVKSKASNELPPAFRKGEKFPDWVLHDLSGDEIAITDSENCKIIYLSMINCGPCQIAIPYIDKIYSSYKNNDKVDFHILYPMDTKEKLKKYVKTKNIKTPIIYNSITEDRLRLELIYKLKMGYPSVLLLDKENIIQQIIVGFQTNLEKRIKEELEL